LGLALAVAAKDVSLDFIASDELISAELERLSNVRVLNLRGETRTNVPLARRVVRMALYYCRLLRYVSTTQTRILHVLWNNKLEYFDRTLLMLYYRALRKVVVCTVHNVNSRQRDGKDSVLNRWTLRFQYRIVDHLFVHTRQMKEELERDFGVRPTKISVIPFGINETVPNTGLTRQAARVQLQLAESAKVILFFGNIAPYKGLEFLVEAFSLLRNKCPELRLVIAGRPKGELEYWRRIETLINRLGVGGGVVSRPEYVPDEQAEVYFKAADVLVLPYVHVFQSGVLFLGYGFGLPVVATNVASMQDDVFEGMTGYTCPPRDAVALANTLRRFFASELHASMPGARRTIQDFARTRNSWATVADITSAVYDRLR
jgi:glycosyltransferase involved in cell wall biosynthesis